MLYTEGPDMLPRKALTRFVHALVLVFPLIQGCGAERSYDAARIVDLQQKTREKVDMYLVNTPVTTAVPYFQVSVELRETVYLAEYAPRRAGEELPEAWRVGETVQCRVEKHHIYVQRPDGTEMQWSITKKSLIDQNKSHE